LEEVVAVERKAETRLARDTSEDTEEQTKRSRQRADKEQTRSRQGADKEQTRSRPMSDDSLEDSLAEDSLDVTVPLTLEYHHRYSPTL
jgi:hypothetical protein